MKKTTLMLLAILSTSMLVLAGCKKDAPVPEVNEPEVRQPNQPEQPGQPEQKVDEAAAKQAAVEAAEAWLAVLDAGQYEKTRDEAAALFRNAVPKEQWQQSIKMLRDRCGRLVSRQLLSKKYTADMPNAPAGEYVIIQYQTRFQNRTAAVETITPMLDRDGKWRVSGYYIK